jgi:hypothetical protein
MSQKHFTNHVDLRIHLRSKFGFLRAREFTETLKDETHHLVLYYHLPTLTSKEDGQHVGTWDNTVGAGWGAEALELTPA